MDFLDLLFPDSSNKLSFPAQFTYRSMICTFINLNDISGKMLLEANYDKERLPNVDTDLVNAVEVIENDELFDYMIALFYRRMILDKNVRLIVDQNNVGKIIITLDTMPSMEYFKGMTDMYQISIGTDYNTIYSSITPFNVQVNYDGTIHDKQFIVDTSIHTSTDYEMFSKFNAPFLLQVNISDISDVDQDDEFEKNYTMQKHVGLFEAISTQDRPLNTAIQFLNRFISPSGILKFHYKKAYLVDAHNHQLSMFIILTPSSTDKFEVLSVDLDTITMRTFDGMPNFTNNVNMGVMASFVTYALSGSGALTIPTITHAEMSNYKTKSGVTAYFNSCHVLLDYNLPYHTKLCDMTNVINTMMIEYQPNELYIAYPFMDSFKLKIPHIILFGKVNAHSNTLNVLLQKFTSDEIKFVIVAESPSWIYFELIDASYPFIPDYLFGYLDWTMIPKKDIDSKIDAKTSKEIMKFFDDALETVCKTTGNLEFYQNWRSNYRGNKLIYDETPVKDDQNSDREINDKSFFGRLKEFFH